MLKMEARGTARVGRDAFPELLDRGQARACVARAAGRDWDSSIDSSRPLR